MPTKECRLCLRHEESCVSLFKQRRGTKLAEIVKFCARIEIFEDDGLPGDACPRCVDEALNAYLFVNKCRRSDAELRTAQTYYSNEDEEAVNTEVCSVAEDTLQESNAHENIEMSSKVVIDGDSIEYNSTVSKSLVEPNDSINTELDRIVSNYTETKQSHQIATENVPYEFTVKSESMNQSGEETDEFFVEYLDDDFKTDLLGDESITEEHLLELNQDELSLGLQDKTKASIGYIEQNKIFICCGTRCRAVMATEQQLAEHIVRIHLPHREPDSNEKPFECNRCYARFQSEKSLSLHSRKSSHCPLCLKICYNQSEKRIHMHQVHGQLSSNTIPKSTKKICCGCYKSFDDQEDLRRHSMEQHAIRKNAVDESRPLQCDICYKLFRTLESLRIHQRFVYRPKNFTCLTCSRAFDTRSKLTNHSLVHSQQRSYQCDKCDKAFKKAVDLKSHQLLHNDKKEECTICGLRFHRKSNLKMHMRKHQNTFFYACPDCPKQFKNNSHLKEHYKVHTKQKPYNCRFCERRFAYCSDRKRHEMTHTGDYPFECQCLKKFTRKTTYEKHLSVCLERAENSV